MSALEGDREAVMKTLGDTIRALEAPDQWRILATVLSALSAAAEYPAAYQSQIEGHSGRVLPAGRFWKAEIFT